MKRDEIIIVLFSVTSAIILISYWKGYLDPFLRELLDPLWMSVFVTTILVIINIIYILQNNQSIREMEKARKASLMPYIKITLTWLGPIFIILEVTNVGKGPATNIKATITFSPSMKTRPLEQSMMQPNDHFRILLPDGDINRVCNTASQISFKGGYSDIFGQSFKIDETIDTKEFIENAKQLQPILESDLLSEVKGIKQELKEIKEKLRS
ncbi:MAG: hypothetical protein FK732_12120 [Asgard group archaeon]|nr:hypothetical protein [Asgard group archaeon]